MVRRRAALLLAVAIGAVTVHAHADAASKPIDGLDFSAFAAGARPSQGPPAADEVRTRLQIIAPHTQWVRIYGCNSGTSSSGATAHNLGMKVALGATLTGGSGDAGELNCLVSAIHRGEVDIAVVGNEALYSRTLTEAQLISDIRSVRSQAAGTPVTTGEPFSVWENHPRLVAAVDLLFGHYYPFLKGDAISVAMADMQSAYSSFSSAANGKAAWVAETGWPNAGGGKGNAVASDANAGQYLSDLSSWATANNVHWFWFASFDEAYKAPPEYKAHYGLWDQNNNPKPYLPA